MLFHLSQAATLLALFVVALGAYVRLSNAGLGCPDWPGCYGRMMVSQVSQDQTSQWDRPLEKAKAWKEMIHRYGAGSLSLMALALFILSWLKKEGRGAAIFLLLLIFFQALLGMWTVTLKLHPFVVMGHLLGGFTTLGALGWMTLGFLPEKSFFHADKSLHRLALFGLVFLILQICLGGWVSANYSSLVCPSFPGCFSGNFWPQMDFAQAFFSWPALGENHEFGLLQPDARIAIQMTHRIIAFFVLTVMGCLAMRLLKIKSTFFRFLGFLLLSLPVMQIGLGISTALLSRPLPVAVLHNMIAALLLLVILTLVKATSDL